jgi:predicted nucleic acid-binding protein
MNHAYVVDASVAVKWVLNEEFSELARALLQDSRRSLRPLFAPPHMASEVSNAIYKHLVLYGDITQEEADGALTGFVSWPPVQFLAPPGLYQGAFVFARANGLPNLYDSLYVILAQLLDAEFWTDDRQLIRRVGSAAPWIRWLGDYQPQ